MRFANGWVRAPRELRDELGLFDYAVYLTLVSWANRIDNQSCFGGQTITLKRGQLITSLSELSDESLDPYLNRIRKALTHLVNRTLIAQSSHTHRNNGGLLITVLNYDELEGSEIVENNHPNTHRTQGAQHIEEEEEEKNKYIGLSDTKTLDHEALYQAYPKRKGSQRKTKGLETLKKKIKTQEQYDKILTAIKNYHAECEVNQKLGTEYVLQFATFVNGVWEEYAENTQIKPAPKKLSLEESLLELDKAEAAYNRMTLEEFYRFRGRTPAGGVT